MKNKNKVKELLERLDTVNNDTYPSQVGKKFDEMDGKIDQVKNDFNLSPIHDSLNQINQTILNKETELKEILDQKTLELSHAQEISTSENDQTNAALLQEITDLKKALSSLSIPKDNTEMLRGEIASLATKMTGSQTSFQSALDKTKGLIPNLSPLTVSLTTLEQKVETIRADLLSRMSDIHGGGQANRNIKFSGSVLTRYTDLNLLGASFTNNDTTKQADVTLPSSGGGSTNPGGLNTQVQFNNNGSFGGVSSATTNGSILTLTNPSIIGAVISTSSVNGVYLQSTGSVTSFLNASGAYSTPAGGGSGNLSVGVTSIVSGTNGRVLYDNNGTLGEMATTGSGIINVLQTSPSIITADLGTPTALVATNATGTAAKLTVGSVITNANLTGVVTSGGNATSFGSFTSSTLSAALSDETGSGVAVFATSPTVTTPTINTGSTFTPSGTSSENFSFTGRSGVTFPVPYLTPTTANTNLAFDLFPKGTPGNVFSIAPVWMDICSTDIVADGTNYECVRVSKQVNGVGFVTTSKGGTGSYRDFVLQYDFGNNVVAGKTGVGIPIPTANLDITPSTSSVAALRVRSGSTPTSPNTGDLWFDGSHLQFRNGSTTDQLDNQSGVSGVTSVLGTANRITSSGGTNPVIDISSTFEATLGKVGSPLSQFAATTSSLLAGVISDETGTGALVFGTSPTLTTAVLGSSTATTQTPADNSTKVATTAYVDAAVLGQNFKEAALVATTANLVGVYLSGIFTYTATGTDTIDGVTLALNNRVLVKNQTTTFQNGIYIVTTAGALGVAGVLTRASDANTSAEFKTGDSIFITSGTANANTTWAYTGIDSPSIGTDAITYAQTAGQGTVTAGNGIAVTGLSVAIDTSVTVDKTTAQTLTNKTLTSPILTTPAIGVANGTSLVLTGTTSSVLAVGRNGITNPTLQIDNSVSSAVTGVVIKASTLGTGVSLTTISSGTNEPLIIDAKGSGNIRIGTNSTGNVGIGNGAGASNPSTVVYASQANPGSVAGYTTVTVKNTDATGRAEFALGTTDSDFAGFVAMAGPSTTNQARQFDIGSNVNGNMGLWTNDVQWGTIDNTGRFGIGSNQPAPSAIVHVTGASTGATGTAPIKLTSGSVLSAIENGTIEYNGSHLYFSAGSTRYQLDQQTGAFILTLAGNLTTAGAFNQTLTATATTNVTLPAGTTNLATIVPQVMGATQNRLQLGGYSNGTSATNGTVTANILYSLPFMVTKTTTVTVMASDIETNVVGNAEMGIYADNGNGLPGALVLDAGNFSTNSLGTRTITGLSTVLTPGQYWVAIVYNATPGVKSYPNAGLIPTLGSGSTINAASSNFGMVTMAQTYGALPSNFSTTPTYVSSAPYPIVGMLFT